MSSGPPFRQVRIPADMGKEVVAVLREHPHLGYRTLSDFVRAATAEKLRGVEIHLALRALRLTTELGADAVEAVIRDSLPREYRAILESERRRQQR